MRPRSSAPASRRRREGQIEAAQSLALSELQVFTRVVLPPSLQRVWPALVSQIIIVMLGSAVCGQISTNELSYAVNLIHSRNFRAFEATFIGTGDLSRAGDRVAPPAELGRAPVHLRTLSSQMVDFSIWDIFRNLLLAARWTVALSLIAFVGGGLVGLALLVARIARWPGAELAGARLRAALPGHAAPDAALPRLLRPGLLGINVSPWVAASLALTLYTSAFLTEIWRGWSPRSRRGNGKRRARWP